MKRIFFFSVLLFFAEGVIFISCKKELVANTLNTSNNPNNPSRPPVAKASGNQIIFLPTNAVYLNGRISYGTDHKITGYLWTKISGPLAFTIVNPDSAFTQVTNLVEGTYQFELKVTDSAGLTGKDTASIQVLPKSSISPPSQISCSLRPVVIATLVPFGTLSTPRFGMSVASVGSKILFAGGSNSSGYSSRVDIFDTITKNWSTAELTVKERQGMAVATVGNKIFFAGGEDADNGFPITSRVDIYDAVTGTWSTAELSQPRAYLAAVTLGDKIFFAGGANWGALQGQNPSNFPPNANYFVGLDVVDIYDNNTNSWTTAHLSEGRYELSATAAGNRIYFAGGLYSIFGISSTIDIYDALSNTWSTSQLSGPRTGHVGISSGNKIFWAGGATSPYWYGYSLSDNTEIRDLISGPGQFSLECFIPKAMQIGAVKKNDNIVFISGWSAASPYFDIYNITANTWSTGVLPVYLRGSSVISVNNTIYVAGGEVNGNGNTSSQVWKLEFLK